MSKQWFVMYCKSREESRAFQHLRNQGIESFFPKIKKEKIIRGKKTVTEEALFPSYLFVHVAKEDNCFGQIRSTRGINDFVRFGNKVATASGELIEQLKQLCYVLNDLDNETNSLFKAGDKITITEGAFKGAKAIFESNDGLERSVLLLNILNQEKSISFPNKELKRA